MVATGEQAGNLKIEYWPVAKLKPYEKNPRKNDHVVDKIVASIQEFGFSVPVLAKSDGEVIDGHLRLKGAVAIGMLEVPVIPCDGWTDAQVKAFRLLANRSVDWAEWDMDALALELAELKENDFDLALTGFDESELDEIMTSAGFGATSADSQGKLDQKKRHTCPECGHEFA